MFNSSTNSLKFKINFSNKCFMSKVYFMDSHPRIINELSLGSKMLSGEVKTASELEQLEKDAMSMGEGMSLVQGLFVIRHGKRNLI